MEEALKDIQPHPDSCARENFAAHFSTQKNGASKKSPKLDPKWCYWEWKGGNPGGSSFPQNETGKQLPQNNWDTGSLEGGSVIFHKKYHA